MARRSLRVTIARWGSTGDVHPYIAVGWELARRGHSVTLIANPAFEPQAKNAGMAFVGVGTVADHERLVADDAVWDRNRKAVEAIYRDHYYPHIGGFFDAAERLWSAESPSVVLIGEFAVALAAEKRGVPTVYMACSPATSYFTQSRYDRPYPQRVLPRWAQWLARTGRGMTLLYVLKHLRDRGFRRPLPPAVVPDTHPLVALRAAKGLPRTPPTAPCICLWPSWYAAPQRDWPKDAMVTDFPFYPPPADSEPARKRADAPIVVTTGSVASGQGNTYLTAIAACRTLGRPAILVTRDRAQIPADLPPTITHVPHAPFHELFNRASLVVHHGGIGTAAYAIAAGVPQVVMPMRGDQFDNGNRLQRLGIARMIPRTASATQLARTIDGLLRSKQVAGRCRHCQALIDPSAGVQAAATRIEAAAG